MNTKQKTPHYYDTDITARGSIAEIVKQYEIGISEVEMAYKILATAEKRLKKAFSIGSKHDTDFGTLPSRNKGYTENVDDSIDDVKDALKRKAWRALYDLLEVDRIASIKRRDEIYKLLENGDLPEITVESIADQFNVLYQNINEFAKESVIEVYKWLRPEVDRFEMTRYKTNQKNATYELGMKVIKTNMIDQSFGGFRVNSYYEKYLMALDRVFHMLDGKNAAHESYRSPLVDAINQSEGPTLKTDYFYVSMYKNRNIHIEFLRKDLVQKFNAIAGGANLKPTN